MNTHMAGSMRLNLIIFSFHPFSEEFFLDTICLQDSLQPFYSITSCMHAIISFEKTGIKTSLFADVRIHG